MSKLPKIPISRITDEDLTKLKASSIRRANAIFRARPFVTKVWMCMNTSFPQKFIYDNWEEISKID